jgi:hypothetical protein
MLSGAAFNPDKKIWVRGKNGINQEMVLTEKSRDHPFWGYFFPFCAQ